MAMRWWWTMGGIVGYQVGNADPKSPKATHRARATMMKGGRDPDAPGGTAPKLPRGVVGFSVGGKRTMGRKK